MADPAQSSPDIATALAEAIKAGGMPSALMESAVAIQKRLEQPLRVSMMGMPWSGKTAVLNLLAGDRILSDSLRGATLEFVYGDDERAVLTNRDGSEQVLVGKPDFYRIGIETPAYVKFEVQVPALRKISLLELSMPSEPGDQARALKWMAKKTDIAIWCTEDFTAEEQALWQIMPAKIKDHAILLRTKADLLGSDRSTALDKIMPAAEEEFAFHLALSAQQAVLARQPDGSINKAEMRASGGTTLISTILRQIENGRQNALDQAEYLLMKAKTMPAVQTPPAAKAEPEPAPTPEPQPAPAPLVLAPENKTEPMPTPRLVASTPDPKPAAEPTPLRATAPTPVEVPSPAPAEQPQVLSVAARLRELQKAKNEPDTDESGPQRVMPRRVTSRPEIVAAVSKPIPVPPAEPAPIQAVQDESPSRIADIMAFEDGGDEFHFDPHRAGEIIAETPKALMTRVDAIRGTEQSKQSERDVLSQAIDRLSEVGATLKGAKKINTNQLFTESIETLDWVTDKLSETETYEDLRDIAMDASDTMQLVKIEAGSEGVDEAISMMLQLKRAFQSELAQ